MTNEKTVDDLWEAIKKVCCVEPEKAVRVIQFTKADLKKAVKLLADK